jgi:hypothetical protein
MVNVHGTVWCPPYFCSILFYSILFYSTILRDITSLGFKMTRKYINSRVIRDCLGLNFYPRISYAVSGFDKLQVVVPQRLVSKLHMLHPTKNSTRYYVVVNVDVHMCHRKISVRSPLQVNSEDITIELYVPTA